MKKYFRVGDGSLFYDGPDPESLEEAWAITFAKWEMLRSAAEEGKLLEDGGITTCGLCVLYDCHECPIHESGEGCTRPGTAYAAYEEAVGGGHPEEALSAAEAEIEFLERIRRESDD